MQEHRSTIVFVNNRRGAERLAVRLNELAGEERRADGAARVGRAPPDIARAHHGSLAREERLVVEDLLKSGELPCLVATSSLELGIDMGAVDLVIQVESPKSVTAGLQRIGRAGHGVGEVSRGPHLPQVPRRPARVRRGGQAHARRRHRADRRAAQPARRARPADRRDRRPPATSWSVPELHDLVRRAYPFAELSRELLDSVLDMLDGRYPSRGVRRAAAADRLGPRGGHDPRAQGRAASWRSRTPARSPTAASTACTCPTAAGSASSTRRWSTRRARARRSCSARRTWRIEEITRDRVIVTPAPGRAGRRAVLEGRRHRPARRSSGEAIGAFAREAVDRDPAELAARVRPRRARRAQPRPPSCASSATPRASCPRDRTIVVERFRDEIGDWRLCVLSPFGGRVHAAWALALSARIRDEFGLESDAIWSDDGIIVHLPDADEPPSADLVMVEPDALEELVVRELSGSALFGARFRENAARALLLPRAYPGKRTPLWQQRLKAQSLLEVAKRYGQFPIVLETYRECLRDVLDLPGLEAAAARAAHARAVAGRGRDPARLAVRLVAAVRLRRHLHVRGRHAQRRAARGGAVARPRPAARAARPGGAARPDRPGGARRGRGRPPAR